MKRQIGRSVLALLLALVMLGSLAFPVFAEGGAALTPPAASESLPEETAEPQETAAPEEGTEPEAGEETGESVPPEETPEEEPEEKEPEESPLPEAPSEPESAAEAVEEAGADSLSEEAPAPLADTDPVQLTDLPIQASHNGWGDVLTNGTNAGGKPITLWDGEKAVEYGRGIGMHAFTGTAELATVEYDISAYTHNVFRAIAGVDYNSDSTGANRGSCVFEVLADGELLWSSEGRRAKDPALQVEVLIPAGTRTLCLRVTDAGDSNTCDWADWVDARLETDPDAPKKFASLSLNAPAGTLKADEQMVLTARGQRLDGSEIENILSFCRFESSDPAVLTVDQTGLVTAVAQGRATVNVTAQVDGIEKTASVDLTVLPGEEDGWSVTSPSGNIRMQLVADAAGRLQYLVWLDGEMVVLPSPLGLHTSLGEFTDGLVFQDRTDTVIDETYSMISGKKAEYRNHANESTFSFTKEGIEGITFQVILRAYDDGVAVRYAIDGAGDFTISGEDTAFAVPVGSTTTMLEYGSLGHCYEDTFAMGTFAQTNGKTYNMPFLYVTPEDTYVLVTEAALSTEYCGSVLRSSGGMLNVTFAPTQGTDPVVTSGPWQSPWRTAIIGGPKEIVENTMVKNLSPACAIEDTSWIQPATTAWTWYVSPGYGPQSDPELIKKYIDVAAELGWKYFLMDEGWQGKQGTVDDSWHKWVGIPDWLDEVVAYGKEKGVGIMAWVHSGDIDTPKEQEFIKELHEHGIVGMKIDFFDSESQKTMELYDTLYKLCAEYEMMLDIHGANKPTGEVRTWPNLLTREGIKAQEFNDVRAGVNTMYVFTRAAVGPADYNPCIDLLQGGDVTASHKVALNILYETGLPCPSDNIEAYKRYPVYTLMKNMPARWDDLRYISGTPGDSAVLARRNGEDWYVAGICTGAQDAVIPLDFLGQGEYTAYIYQDGASRWEMKLDIRTVTAQDTLTIPMLENGGCTVKITKDDPLKPETISVPESLTLTTGEAQTLEMTMTPADAQYLCNLHWSTSNDEIVSVNGSGNLTAHKPGVADVFVTATYPFGEGVTLSASCRVTVKPAEWALADPWQRRNPDPRFVLESENAVTLYPLNGQADTAENDVRNLLWFIPEEDDFTATVKCTFEPSSNYQTAGILVSASDVRYVGILRRFHSTFGGNVLETIKCDGEYSEPCVPDPALGEPVWLKLEKKGNQFTSFYSLDNQEWVKLETQTMRLNEGEKWVLSLAGFSGSQAPDGANPILFEDFTYNGKEVPFARRDDVARAVTGVTEPAGLKVPVGTTAEQLSLPSLVSVTLSSGETTDLPVVWDTEAYSGGKYAVFNLTGHLEMPDFVENPQELTARIRVQVGEPAPTQNPGGGGSREPSATATPTPAPTPAPTAKPGKGGAVKPTATPEATESPVPEETAAPTAEPTPEPEQPDEGETVEPEETPAAAPENGSPWLLWAAIGVAVCAALVLIVVLWQRRRTRED